MKKCLIILFAACVLLGLLAVVFAKPLVMVVVKSAIEKAVPGSMATMHNCSIQPVSSISFSDIRISKKGIFDISIKDVGLEYDLGSLAKGRLRKAYLRGASINVSSTSKELVNLFPGRGSGPVQPSVVVEEIELSGIKFNITVDGSVATGSMEMLFKNMELLPKKIGLIIDSALVGPVRLKGLRFGVARAMSGGIFGIDSIKVNDINASGISGQPHMDHKELVIDKIAAQVFNGKAEGVLSLALDREASYSLKMKMYGIDTHEAVLAFKLGERVDSTGSVKGELEIEGKGAVLTVVKGIFSVDENGGLFIIKDEEFFKMIAERTKQPIEIIKESFRDYRYNKGTAWLNLEEKDLYSGIAMEGDKGKRNVDMVFHDIIK